MYIYIDVYIYKQIGLLLRLRHQEVVAGPSQYIYPRHSQNLTVPNKIHGKGGSVHIRLVPAPRGTGIVAAPTSKKILQYAGIHDCFTSSSGASSTLGNFAKATFAALKVLYGYLSPDLWKDTKFTKQPFQEFSDVLSDHKQYRDVLSRAFVLRGATYKHSINNISGGGAQTYTYFRDATEPQAAPMH